jgi:hypothetical protein
LNFESPCSYKDLVTINPAVQPVLSPDSYSAIDIVFTYAKFTVEPSYCDLTVKCASVSPSNVNLPCKELEPNGKLTWNFKPEDYSDRKIAPGSYVYTFDVTASEGDADLTEQFTVTVTLEDPCKNPIVVVPESAALVYTLTDTDKTIVLSPQASISPAICQLDSETTAPADSGIQDNVVYNRED